MTMPLPLDEQHRLIVNNRALVYHISRQIGSSLEYDEKVSLGFLGLAEAARRYDPTIAAFTTYAALWIRAYIYREMMAASGIPQGSDARKVFFKIRKVIRSIEGAGQEATNERVAKRIGVSEESVSRIRALLFGAHVRLDAHPDVAKLMGVKSDDNPEQSVIEADGAAKSKARVRRMLQRLAPVEREVIKRRFVQDPPSTLQQIGDDHNRTREWARLIEAKALRKIKATWERTRESA